MWVYVKILNLSTRCQEIKATRSLTTRNSMKEMTVKSGLQFPDTDETIEDTNKIKLIVASFVESRAMERDPVVMVLKSGVTHVTFMDTKLNFVST